MATAAQRARARRDPAVQLPPRPPSHNRVVALAGLKILISGQTFVVGPALEGDPVLDATWDGAETISLGIRDSAGVLRRALADEDQVIEQGVFMRLDGLDYALQSFNNDGTLVNAVFEDIVAWRLRQFTSFRRFLRSLFTRAQAAGRLVDEAAGMVDARTTPLPLAPMRAYIPELNDRQAVAAADVEKSSGTGASTAYTVKGKRATARQRQAIDAALGRCQARRASRRLMIATIMAATQESRLGEEPSNGNHLGLYHQDPGWGTEAERRDDARATDAWLDGWKRVHGSLRNVPGDLAAAIESVQRSGNPTAYARWEGEATATVDRWRSDGPSNSTSDTEPYEFTRGERGGQREDSFAALGRWAEDVTWRRWAQDNTLFFVSDEELRAAAPALEINGDEPWLLSFPAGDYAPGRPVAEVTITVLAERWGVRIGAAVLVNDGSVRGTFLVSATHGGYISPELQVTLTRPTRKQLEPASDSSASSTSSSSADGLLAACETISKQGRDYQYGGGHGPKLSAIGPHDKLDCSSSVSLALWKAGLFGDRQTAITSGAFATSFGKPGRGKEWTVYANDGHVWVKFEKAGRYKRFDTSPHGSGDNGPRVRTTARNDETRFTARHLPGH